MHNQITAVGFIGLGNMGFGMATHLLSCCLDKGISLYVYDINTTPVDALCEKGAQRGESIASMASNCQVIFTSLPSAKEINSLAFGSEGILENAGQLTWFETSTNDVTEWEKVKAAADLENMQLIDAPVTGGAEGARAGQLTMLLGGSEEAISPYRFLLDSFTKKVALMGPSGSGYVAKLVQLHLNYLVALGIGEAMMLAAKANLNLDALYPVLQNSCAQSYVVDNYIPKVLDGSYDPSFTLGLATKDMRLIQALGQFLSVEMPLGEQVVNNYEDAVKRYGDAEPHLSVIRLIEDSSQQLIRGNA